ncbi:hypothetical protein CCU68_02490 [Pseudomonas gingeri NCPPB 3146 = LMG 5327]|uniref:Uncharacterized protein n=3 Tax=Pseudomonas gingeri TaxID=117681 RepID=A0A7Y7Y0U4_9PSED|nr:MULTISPECIES: hypothetical protein [Pseudomonas]NVZ26338.1 hypothetical protein [Pseudomonas gingeri]NWA01930.1 hypothetical protein [Pseudomonas gingeri]NWA17938.1 hypothetical protein [Pseudomonas gingeri]NWA53407.1 hypothetical protein [Pseudomonas gingeri]NWA95280.1 hypothetical protein [Pseudomonas gingeri]
MTKQTEYVLKADGKAKTYPVITFEELLKLAHIGERIENNAGTKLVVKSKTYRLTENGFYEISLTVNEE